MGVDFWIVVQWWGMLFLVGAVAYPLTKYLFSFTHPMWGWDFLGKRSQRDPRPHAQLTTFLSWWDEGYLFSKAVGMATVTWIVYVLGTLKLLPFSSVSIIASLFVVFFVGIVVQLKTSLGKASTVSSAEPNRDKQNSKLPTSLKELRGASKTTTQNEKPEDGFPVWSRMTNKRWLFILVEEFFFFLALVFWSWVKGHESSIHGLEKFMDYGFMQSILGSRFFPPADMWYAGYPINYYYFGHMVVAVLTKLSGLNLVYAFNLMLATVFAMTLTMSFSIGYQISQIGLTGRIRKSWHLVAGLLTAFLVTLAGNMQTIYAFTRGYTGDNVRPFWELTWSVSEFWKRLPEGMATYWYANATRFIPWTIHEFPGYSFVVSDVHGHVLSIPFVLLAIALLIHMVIRDKRYVISNTQDTFHFSLFTSHFSLLFYGFLVGVLLMTNAIDGPIYLGLLIAILGISNFQFPISKWKNVLKQIVVVIVIAVVTSLPFLSHFQSFVTGLAVNCPPDFLANSRIGPIIFEGVEKCQKSPIWMLWLLWGFFVYCGAWFMIKIGRILHIGHIRHIWDTKFTQVEKLLLIFFLFSVALIIFPEFFYFKDIYPMHFRSNTMFKLGYQAFILFSIVAGYTITASLKFKIQNSKFKIARNIFLILLLPQLMLVSIYPIFAVRSYFNGLGRYEGLNGLAWFTRQYPDDWAAIEWLNQQESKIARRQESKKGEGEGQSFTLPVLVEADGDSYTDSARFSAFTGMPTVIGWPVHEWLWRGTYDVVAPRREDVRKIYESDEGETTRHLLAKYRVRYVIVGTLERQKYERIDEKKLESLGLAVFRRGSTVIYDVSGAWQGAEERD